MVDMVEIEVKIPAEQAGSYRVTIGAENLSSLWPKVEADFSKYNPFVVTDENLVSAGHLQRLLGCAKAEVFVISPAGEGSKNIDTVVSIIEAMEKASLGRDTVVVACCV